MQLGSPVQIWQILIFLMCYKPISDVLIAQLQASCFIMADISTAKIHNPSERNISQRMTHTLQLRLNTFVGRTVITGLPGCYGNEVAIARIV